MPTNYIVVTGKVQGVFFRATAKQVARELELTGWVKNTGKDRVELMVTGPKDSLEVLVNWCRHGPPGADVAAIECIEKEETFFESFTIIK